MALHELSDDFLVEIADLFNRGMNKNQLAKKYDKTRSVAQYWIRRADKAGLITKKRYWPVLTLSGLI